MTKWILYDKHKLIQGEENVEQIKTNRKLMLFKLQNLNPTNFFKHLDNFLQDKTFND